MRTETKTIILAMLFSLSLTADEEASVITELYNRCQDKTIAVGQSIAEKAFQGIDCKGVKELFGVDIKELNTEDFPDAALFFSDVESDNTSTFFTHSPGGHTLENTAFTDVYWCFYSGNSLTLVPSVSVSSIITFETQTFETPSCTIMASLYKGHLDNPRLSNWIPADSGFSGDQWDYEMINNINGLHEVFVLKAPLTFE